MKEIIIKESALEKSTKIEISKAKTKVKKIDSSKITEGALTSSLFYKITSKALIIF